MPNKTACSCVIWLFFYQNTDAPRTYRLDGPYIYKKFPCCHSAHACMHVVLLGMMAGRRLIAAPSPPQGGTRLQVSDV